MEFSDLIYAALVALVSAGGLLTTLAIARSLLFICRPNEILVVSGKRHRSSGGVSNFSVIQAGTHWRVPLLQNVYRLDARLMPIELQVMKVLSNGGIPLDVHAIANVKITSDPQYVYNAVERFLNVPVETIQMTARQTLEGALREVVAQLTPEQVNEDRIEFANKLVESTTDIFSKMGLHLDTLKIQRVEDEAKYLVNIGRTQIANAIRDAENAESQANQEIAKEEATARQSVELAQKQAAIAVAQKRNQLRAIVGQLEGTAQSAERESAVFAEQVRAEAEQELQEIRKQLETKRLYAEVVLPAEAQRTAAELTAEGDAALPREQGAATAEAMRQMAEAIAKAGPKARELFVLSHLDALVEKAANRVKEVAVGEIHVVDSGDGRSLPLLSASYPSAVAALLSTLKEVTGVDVLAMFSNSTALAKPASADGGNP
ncbi:MAG TPA: SPFH domain-containing protein [Myxococcaceae bacterium]|nr:SPFH domain-containing protein [Myxococcaceae bacterium]